VIIGSLVSLPGRRLAATLLALFVLVIAALGVVAGALPDSTWVALKPLPQQGRQPVFALAVDPSNNQVLIAANSEVHCCAARTAESYGATCIPASWR
jgi:hypothetical protein